MTSTGSHRESVARKYELWRPALPARRRAALERIHRAVADAWSQALTEYLPAGARIDFETIGFEPGGSIGADENDDAQIGVFSIAKEINGCVIVSGALAKSLVSARLGIAIASESFTRIETAIARETLRTVIATLGEVYRGTGLGRIGGVHECERMADGLGFNSGESVARMRFRVTAPHDELRLIVALSSNVIRALPEDGALGGQPAGKGSTARAVAKLPIDADVVLGSWELPISDLAELRAGDTIVLPEGDQGWIAARGVSIWLAQIQLNGKSIGVEIKGSARPR